MLFDQVNLDVTAHIESGLTDISCASMLQGPNTVFSLVQCTSTTTMSITSIYFNTYIYDAPAGEVIQKETVALSGALVTFTVGYGPDGSVLFGTSSGSAAAMHFLSVRSDGSVTLRTLSLPGTDERIVAVEKVHGAYIILSKFITGSSISISAYVYDLANYVISSASTVDTSTLAGSVSSIGDIEVSTFAYGGYYQVLYYKTTAAAQPIYMLDYDQFSTSGSGSCVGTDGLMEWDGVTTTDTTYASDATPGTQLTLLTTCKDTELAAGQAGTLETIVTATQDSTGDTASILVSVTAYNSGAGTAVVGTPLVTVLAADPGAATWVARAYVIGNYVVIYGHADGSANDVHWHSKGTFVKVESVSPMSPGGLIEWGATTSADTTYVDDATPGTVVPALTAGAVTTLAAGETANATIIVTASAAATGDVAGFRITGTLHNTAGTTALVGTPTVDVLAADAGAATWVIRVYFSGNDLVVYGHADGSVNPVVWFGRGLLIII